MKKKKKKITKNRKKFFIILGCYIGVFLITCLTTAATLAWFNSSTFATNTVYLGGPVYLYFGDTNNRETSKENNLVLTTPPGWNYLYPGMNIQLQARAVVQGAEFEHEEVDGETTIVTATGAILRARIMVKVLPPEDSDLTPEAMAIITQDIYRNIWSQVKAKALSNTDNRNNGVWVFDDDYNYTNSGLEEDHFFYYVKPGQDDIDNEEDDGENKTDSGDFELLEVGGTIENDSVGFLDNAVITLSGKQLTNDHADCRIQFTIIFHALQAFLPFTMADVGQDYPGATDGRKVVLGDVGDPKPLTIENSRRYFYESFEDIYGDDEGSIY